MYDLKTISASWLCLCWWLNFLEFIGLTFKVGIWFGPRIRSRSGSNMNWNIVSKSGSGSGSDPHSRGGFLTLKCVFWIRIDYRTDQQKSIEIMNSCFQNSTNIAENFYRPSKFKFCIISLLVQVETPKREEKPRILYFIL